MKFILLEIGCDEDHVHFLIQSVPMLSPKKIVNTIKSITAREIFRLHSEVKRFLWSGKFWTSGYYINTVGQYANEEIIKKYVQGQGSKQKYQRFFLPQISCKNTVFLQSIFVVKRDLIIPMLN